ncbi:MAG: hypothetical protein ING02_05975 [Roseomonas sp.]|nr:hypothetical protein [Roseomonas sp.]
MMIPSQSRNFTIINHQKNEILCQIKNFLENGERQVAASSDLAPQRHQRRRQQRPLAGRGKSRDTQGQKEA